jgi:hypothetical protein
MVNKLSATYDSFFDCDDDDDHHHRKDSEGARREIREPNYVRQRRGNFVQSQ